jgi:PhnB protein
MRLNPYLNFSGNCEEAMQFYARVFRGKVADVQKFSVMPDQAYTPPGWSDKVMHASVTIGRDALMGSDVPPSQYAKPQGYAVSVQTRDKAEAERVYRALADGGTETLPIQKTFWSEAFGMCTDRFGIAWMVNHNPDAD